MKKIITMIVIGIMFTTFLLSYTDPIIRKKSPLAEKGVLDLTSWDFHQDGFAALNGEWECYDGQLLAPEDFMENTNPIPQQTGYSIIKSNLFQPGVGTQISPEGIRTFRLIVKTDNKNQYYGIKINRVFSSSKLYINGDMIGYSGNPAIKEEGYLPSKHNYESFFLNDSGQIEIILQVANYNYPLPALFYRIMLGDMEKLRLQTNINLAVEACGAALCFFISLYYMYLYYVGKKEKGALYSFLEFILFHILFLFSGEEFIYFLIPQLPFELFMKFQRICYIGITLSIIAFCNIENKNVISDKLFKRTKVIIFSYITCIIVTPLRMYIYLDYLLHILILTIFLYIIYRIGLLSLKFKVKRQGRYNALLYILCLAALFTGVLNNFLSYLHLITNKTIGSIAIGLFLILSQIFLAFRFTNNYEKMLDMEKLKDEFFIKSSYVLNAPLNSIMNLSKSVVQEAAACDYCNGTVQKNAEISKNIAATLLDTVNATLDVTLLQNNQLKLSASPLDMKTCAELVTESFSNLIENNQIVIVNDISDSLLVIADEERLRQILYHLLTNSVRSMTNGMIKIAGVVNGSMVHISIEDNGSGIPEDIREEIFKPYISYRSEGLGLGLYLSRQLIENMGGKIYLDWSEIGKGSRFVFTLPSVKGIKLEQVNRIYPTEKRQYSSFLRSNRIDSNKANNILIVDDELFNLQTATDILSREGYHTLSAFSSEEALRIIDTVELDLVILDVMMPGSSGIETCKKIREKYSIIELPVLMSSSANVNYDFYIGIRVEANDFISKPFMERELIARVKTLITLKNSIEEVNRNELAFLQAQIKPHFIYNAINTMVSFCYTDSERAAKLLTNFSQYLRLTFDIDNHKMMVPLSREIELVNAFVEIQNARFGDIYTVNYDIDLSLMNKEIPSFTIQPLVENSIKHAYSKNNEKCILDVAAKHENKYLIITVKDYGVGIPQDKIERLKSMESSGDSVGLWNINRRMRRMKHTSMDIQSIEGKGTTVTLSIKIE